jgi:dTDP-4-dehydrorhamnose 3,5-epimerase-like enzyme
MKVEGNTIADVTLLELPKINNRAGNITAINGDIELPFSINRVFYLYDIPGGESRGAHAHKECAQFLVAAGGSFFVTVDDGQKKEEFFLNQPYKGLLIPPGIWASEINFSSGATCLVLTSHAFDEGDYIRSYKEFLSYKAQWK